MATAGHFRMLALRCLRAIFSRCAAADEGKAHLEVELKFRIGAGEASGLPDQLRQRLFVSEGMVELSDTFLPVAVEGEMMRIRQEKDEHRSIKTLITFKQWVATATGRTRRESERAVSPMAAIVLLVVGRMIGGSPLLGFAKKRQLYTGMVGQHQMTVAIDDVSGLGSFSGWYLEAEVIVPLSGDPVAVQDDILIFAQSLFGDKRQPEKQSYFEMLVRSQSL